MRAFASAPMHVPIHQTFLLSWGIALALVAAFTLAGGAETTPDTLCTRYAPSEAACVRF